MSKIRICKDPGCENEATASGFCRLHYLRNWKLIKIDEQRKAAEKLNKYIENMASRDPDNYIENIKDDLSSEASIVDVVDDGEETELLFEEAGFDEDIDELLKRLKVESGF